MRKVLNTDKIRKIGWFPKRILLMNLNMYIKMQGKNFIMKKIALIKELQDRRKLLSGIFT